MDPGIWSALAQFGCMIAAALYARFRLRSRLAILAIAMLGAFGAMAAHILHDGQGAFMMVIFIPVIYAAATVGRWDVGT
jgi:hypothetical protein